MLSSSRLCARSDSTMVSVPVKSPSWIPPPFPVLSLFLSVYVGATAAAKMYLNGEFPGTETGAGIDVGIDMGVGMCGATTKLFVFFFFVLGHHLFRFLTLFSVPLLACAIGWCVFFVSSFGFEVHSPSLFELDWVVVCGVRCSL